MKPNFAWKSISKNRIQANSTRPANLPKSHDPTPESTRSAVNSESSYFRPGHSTQTVVLRVLSDILASVDRNDFAALIFLDPSAVFDTVDHGILLERLCLQSLRRSFKITDSAHSWLSSYLTGRDRGGKKTVRHGGPTSQSTALECGVPRGSVLGPILFVLYTADLQAVIKRHGLSPHFYADDCKICGFCRPGDVGTLSQVRNVLSTALTTSRRGYAITDCSSK
jgi:hypothetical protein